MKNLWQDVRFSLRMLVKRPAFSFIVLITIALGVGANSAVFSVVNALLLRPLPYPNSEQLVMVWGKLPVNGLEKLNASAGEFVDYRDRNHAFSSIAVYASAGRNLTGAGQPERVTGTFVTGDFFSVLGIEPLYGRTFLDEENQPGRDGVAVLSYSLWQRLFGGDRNIIGQNITLDGRSHTVVGIMPADFQFPDTETAIWKPIGFTADDISANNRGSHYLDLIARMKPGISIQQAQTDVSSIAEQMQKEYPGNYKEDSGWGATVVSLHEEMVGDVRLMLLVLFVTVTFVLLIVCANVANLLLTLAASRQREIAIRSVLGAGRWRTIRQLIIESLVTSFIGGVFGILLALWGTDLLTSFGPESLPRLNEIRVDARVAVFTFGVSLLTGLIFGIVPALQAAKLNINESLKESSNKMTEGKNRLRFRGALVASQIALALVLLVGTGLLFKSFFKLQQVDIGIDPKNVLSLRVSLPQSKYGNPHMQRAFFDRLIEQTEELPNVESAGIVNFLPLSGSGSQRNISVEGKPENPVNAEIRISNSDYFHAMGIELQQGRLYDDHDRENTPYVTVVNETFTRIFFPEGEALGKRVKMGSLNGPFRWLTVVGIIKDVKHRGIDAEARPEMYIPYLQPPLPNWNVQSMFLAVRTGDEPQNLIPFLRGAVHEIDAEQPVYSISTMQGLLAKSTAQRKFNLLLIGSFSALALLLAAIGIYGVMSFTVSQRTQEIGIRVALGAQSRDVMVMVVKQGITYVLIGVTVGISVSFALTRLIENLLFKVSATDLTTFALVSLFLTGVALLACFVPARRASKTDPMVALRYE